jgi:glutathione S-transferase
MIERPPYADHAIVRPFQWARCISSFALLAADDPIRLWHDRMVDLFGGLARSSSGYDS